MQISGLELNKINDNLWEVPKQGGMLVPGRIYTSRNMLEGPLKNDEAIKQVVNVAHLPGIQKYSLAMPDIHWGYGFPIGGVAATDINEGVISPGGVCYDINCGVRLARTSLDFETVKPKIVRAVEEMFKNVPTGVGASGAIKKLPPKEIKNILVNEKPIPYTPTMIRTAANVTEDPDWLVRMLGSHHKKSLLNATHTGASTDFSGTSFVPALVAGADFGKDWPKSILD